MKQCEKCKVYFEEITYPSFMCNKCMPSEVTDAHSAQNTISDQVNRHQDNSQCGSTIGIDSKTESIQSSTLLKTDFFNTGASLESTTCDSLHSIDKNAPFCLSRDEKNASIYFQGYNSFNTDRDIVNQLIVRQFKNFFMNSYSQKQILNLSQNFSSHMDSVNKIPDGDGSADTNSWDSSFLNQRLTSSYSCRNRLFHWKWEKQLARANDSDIFKNKLPQFYEAIYPKSRLSPIQEEIISDSDSVITLAYNSPQKLSPITTPETSPIRKSESLTTDTDSDSSYIDVYDPTLPSGSKLFKCEWCCLRFNAEKHLLKHMDTHEFFQHVKYFACTYNNCNESFTSETEYLIHFNSHRPKFSFKNLSTYQENNLKRKYVDKESGSEFEPSRKRLDSSLESCNNEHYGSKYTYSNESSELFCTEDMFKCYYPHCIETFLTRNELVCHMGTHFGPPYTCFFCSKSFPTLDTYYEDQENHGIEL